jgi:hypothetical protein
MAPPPGLGALGMTFTVMRVMQLISLITIVGISGNFVAEVVGADLNPPGALIGTLVVATMATIYICITYILHWDSQLPMLVATGGDFAITIAVIVIACIVGRPTSYLKCEKFPSKGGDTASFINSLFHNVKNMTGNVFSWVNADKASCYQLKAVWGLSIALGVLFFFSSITCACLWKRLKNNSAPPKDIE